MRALQLIDPSSSRPTLSLRYSGTVRGVAISPDAKTSAAFCGESVCLWNLKTGQEITRLNGPFGEFVKLQFSADGRKLAAVTRSDGRDDDHGTQYQAHVFIWSGVEDD